MKITTYDEAMAATREQALNALVDMYVDKWGEGERDAARRINASNSVGLLLNGIAMFPVGFGGDPNEDVARAAQERMTAADHRALAQGG